MKRSRRVKDSVPLDVIHLHESLPPSSFTYEMAEGEEGEEGTGKQSAPCSLSYWQLLEAVQTAVTSVAVAAAQTDLSH